MRAMTSAETVEPEQRYDVGPSTLLPGLLEIPGVERVADAVTDRLEAVYFDTASLELASRGITLRRRTGGTDHGWHLKIPLGPVQRREIQAPLGQPEIVPEELIDRLLVYTRGEDMLTIARLITERTRYRLYGPGGEHLADFVDDQVHAEAMQQPLQGLEMAATEWREWEIELVHGAPRLLAAAAGTLIQAGASPSQHPSKLARALGGAWASGQARRTVTPSKEGPAVDVVTAYLGGLIDDLLTHDPDVRRGVPDSIHQMRSVTRRIRSVLQGYGALFDKITTGSMRDELKWLAGILGRPRDAEVMRERLLQRIQDLPDPAPSVKQAIEHELGAIYDTGYREVLAALSTERYFRLLDDLEDFRDHPPVTHKAAGPARRVTARLVNKTAKRLDRAQKAVKHARPGSDRDTALHDVRKAAKQLRHAAETVVGIRPKRAPKIARAAQKLQKILGEHQDSVMARTLLDRLAAAPGLPVTKATAYSLLYAAEERIAQDSESKYRKARKKARGLRLTP